MNSMRYLVYFTLIVTLGSHASEKQTQRIRVIRFTSNDISIPIQPGDTYQKLTDSLNTYMHFAPDITYEYFESGKYYKLNPKEIINPLWFDEKNANNMRASRYWLIKPHGTLLKGSTSFIIPVDDNESIQNLKHKIRSYLVKEQLIPVNEYCIVQITHNNKMLSEKDRMPSYRTNFNAQNYAVKIDKVESNPQIQVINDLETKKTLSITLINTPPNLELRQYKTQIDIRNIKIVIFDLSNISVFTENENIGDTFVPRPLIYAFLYKIGGVDQDNEAYTSGNGKLIDFNEIFYEEIYQDSKELLSLWASAKDYSLTEDGLPVPIALSSDRTITIEGYGDKMVYNIDNIYINLHKSKIENVIETYKKLTDLADDITVTIYHEYDIDQKTPITQFADFGSQKYRAKLSRTWNITPQGTASGKQIKPFNINLEEKQSIESIKYKIKENLFLNYGIPEEKLPTINITKNGQLLNDNDTMPLYLEPFNPKEYTVYIFEPASASKKYNPLIIENKPGLPIRVKAQQPTPVGKPAPEKPITSSFWQLFASLFSWSKKNK